MLRLEVSLIVVAAVLSMVGYSLNDTIIIFDRVRENLQEAQEGRPSSEILNRSINETLPRSVLTHGTTLSPRCWRWRSSAARSSGRSRW